MQLEEEHFMSQMNTLQVNTVYTEKLCVCKSQMQLFEEKHAYPYRHATILRYEQPSC